MTLDEAVARIAELEAENGSLREDREAMLASLVGVEALVTVVLDRAGRTSSAS